MRIRQIPKQRRSLVELAASGEELYSISAYPHSSITLIVQLNLSHQAGAIQAEIRGEDLSFLFPSSFERGIDSGPNHLCWFPCHHPQGL
jgi:hypothetical protein